MRPLGDHRYRTHLLMIVLAGLCLPGLTALAAGGEDRVAVTIRVSAPTTTPLGAPIFISGDFQGWDPGDPAHELTDLGGLLYEISLDLTAGETIAFKFTRGTWGTVERGESGEEIPNRTHLVAGGETLDLAVANWLDQPVSTTTGDVTTHQVPGFLEGRRVWVYLPPGYHQQTEHYPVLYMLDGQNLFDQATSFAGEWEVDETCESLIPAESIRPIIVVAVDNGDTERVNEYTPWYDPGFGAGGGGEAHLQEIMTVLIPWVDASYRTLTGPDHTGFSGSSLGGLMSLYNVYTHPDVFGLIGALSPSFWWFDHELLDYAQGQPRPAARVYMDMGTIETGTMVDEDMNGVDDSIDDLRAMRDIMVGQGFVLDDDLMVVEDEGGIHNESFWAQRFPETLRFLFPPVPPTTPTPEPTMVPTATPTAPPPLGVRLDLAREMVHPGEEFWVNAHLDNPGSPLQQVPVFILLDVLQSYYFWPSWSLYDPQDPSSLDYELRSVPTGSTSIPVLPSFTWPDTGSDQMSGLYFHGAMLNQAMDEVLGSAASEEWGYGG